MRNSAMTERDGALVRIAAPHGRGRPRELWTAPAHAGDTGTAADGTEGDAVSKHEAVPAHEGAERDSEDQTPERRPGASDRRVQIAAAKLRVVLDERLNRPTPEWVKRLAEQKLAS